jgi:hypothetical protein
VLDYNLPYHIIEEEDDDAFLQKVSFRTYAEAKEFIQFAPNSNLIIVKTKDLKNYYIGLEYKKYQFK